MAEVTHTVVRQVRPPPRTAPTLRVERVAPSRPPVDPERAGLPPPELDKNPLERNRPNAPRLVERLKERKLFEWLLGYVAAAWIVLQALDPLGEIWDWPLGFQRGVTLALGFGILPATVIAWFHGEKGRQRVSLAEMALLGVLTLASGFAIWRVCG